jgi:hypothetical protein
MTRACAVGLLALASLLAGSVSAQPPVVVPGDQPPAVVPQPPVPVPMPVPMPAPPGSIVPVPPNPSAAPVVLTPAPPMSHREFARIFKPMPGRYEVMLIHPGSRRPVPVCFTLPDGCPRVKVRHRELVFDYGHHHEVVIRFALGGRVRVVTR